MSTQYIFVGNMFGSMIRRLTAPTFTELFFNGWANTQKEIL